MILAAIICTTSAENQFDVEAINSRALISLQGIAKEMNSNLSKMWTVLWREEKITSSSSRTFGRIKRLQSALLPVMFKLGVMSTIIFILLFLALKGILIGKMILIINVAFVIAKLVAWKESFHHQHQSQIGWYPQKDIHVHIHNSHEQPHYSHIPISVHGDEHYDEHGPYRRIGGSSAPSAPSSVNPDYYNYLNDADKITLMNSWNNKLNRRFF